MQLNHRALLIVLAATSFIIPAAMADKALSGYQQQIHDEVKAGLDGVESALAEARSKLDAGDASGASTAYNAAVRSYNNHIRRISQLPTDNDSAAALRKQAEGLSQSIKETADAIKAGPGKPAEKPKDDAPATPAQPASAKLNYQQEEKLKNARYYLNEIEPRAKRILELTAGRLDAEAITEALDLMQFVHGRMGYAVKNLNELPGTHPDVAAESKKYNDLLAKLIGAQEAIEKAAPDADKQVAELGKQMQDDLAMIESWSGLGNPQYLFNDRPEDAIAVVGQLPQMRDAMGQMLTRWTTRSKEKPNDKVASDMVRKLKYVDGQLNDLEQFTQARREALPGEIQKQLGEVEKLIDTAVSERRPLYFGPDGGIAQQTAFAEEKLKMLKAIDPPTAETSEQALAALREKSTSAQKSLSQDIIKSNKKPQERYAGADVEALRQKVIDDWKEKYPDDEIVAVIFNTEGWNRTTRWEWSTGNQAFQKVDYDKIQPKLFYKLNDTQAVEVPVNVYKDYMANERINVSPWEKEPETPVTRIYLLENLK